MADEQKLNTHVIQVTNIAPHATLDQMRTLFAYLGKIKDLKLYPSEDLGLPITSKVCYVCYEDPTSVGVCMHLNNTVLIDRAITIIPISEDVVPDEGDALQLAVPSGGGIPGMPPSWPSTVISKVSGVGSSQIIITQDPKLSALGLPPYPPLAGTTDPTKIEEIRRTVYVGSLDSSVTAEQLLNFFSQAGEIKYVRMAGDETQPTRFAFVEFSDQRSIPTSLTYNGVMFAGRALKVNHSNNAIVKPQAKTQEAAQREIEEAMRKVKEAQSLITAAIEPDGDKKKRSSRSRSPSRKHRSRTRSRSRKRSRSRGSRSKRRSQSRSKGHSRKRSRSGSRAKKRLSRSRSRKRSHTPKRSPKHSPKRSPKRSPIRSKSLRNRSRSPSRRKTPPRAYGGIRRSRSRSRSRMMAEPIPRRRRSTSRPKQRQTRTRSPDRKPRSQSPPRSPVRKVKEKKSTSRSPSPPKLEKIGSMSPRSRKERLSDSDAAPKPLKPSVSDAASTSIKKRSTSRSPGRSSKSPRRRRGHRRSRSPKRRSRSKSGSPGKSARRRKERERSRDRGQKKDRKDRDKDKDSKKSRGRDRDRDSDRDEKLKEAQAKVLRDYDAEEKEYNSNDDRAKKNSSNPPTIPEEDAVRHDSDMDTSD